MEGVLQSSPEETKEQFAIRSALYYLRRAVKNPNAQYKSPEQQQLIENTFGPGDNILAILPTGVGKSLCWEVPVLSEPNTKTIVFTPFVSLINDQLRRASNLGIKAMHWTSHRFPTKDVQLVFISWELILRAQVTKYVYFVELHAIHYL